MATLAQTAHPPHVPEELVRPTPFIFGSITEADPYNEWVPAIHEGPPIFYAPNAYPGMGPAWVVRRMADMREIYMDTDTFSSRDFSPYSKLVGDSWTNLPVEFDPPEHQKYRVFANPLFAPMAMARLEDKIRQYAGEYIDGFKDRGSCEFMSEFAFEFPIKVFLELMGLPLERAPEFLEWEVGLLHAPDLETMASATRSVVAFLRSEIDKRRDNPPDDAFGYALRARIEGGRPLNDDELVGFAFNLFIGGLDTVSTNMGLQVLHLAQNHEHQSYLRENPDKIPHAIEELMRAYAPVTVFRTCTRDVVFKGVQMKAGEKVAMMTTLVNRDPEEFDAPNEVRLDRKPRHTAFGYGVHTCIGMHLARRELKIALEEMLRRLPQFSVKPGHTIRRWLGMIQPVELPLVWETR